MHSYPEVPANTVTGESPIFFSLKQTAQLLGVSVQTIRRLIADGAVPVRQLRRRRVIPAEFLRKLARN